LLDSLGRDLTSLAEKGQLPPLYGRRVELLRLQRILLRKHKNNPLIVGAPGIGKTALVEGLAQSIVEMKCVPALSPLRIIEIGPAQMTAGTHLRGSFEARMQRILEEAGRDRMIVLFVDEIHTLLRAGSAEGGALDAANILKPALSRGEIHFIGATTPAEFERFMQSDPAFERRFEPLFLEEPSIPETIEILSAALPAYERHHFLQILPEAIHAAVELSARYILDRSLPDKALDLLDAACALVRLPENPADLERTPDPCVDRQAVLSALAARIGVPQERLAEGTGADLAGLEAHLNSSIIGQPLAMERIASAIRVAGAGMRDARRPRHIFAFFGSSGTGKTAAALALADTLFDSPDALIRLDMSEFREPHTIARLWGAPPGYTGYQDEGTFASRLRRQPLSVILLDEFEKAHPQVHDAFLQIFDAGRFTDARGRPIEARQAFFILTSNLFSLDEIASPEIYDAHAESVRQSLSALLRPELVNRIDSIILFQSLSVPVLAQIAANEIETLNARLAPNGLAVRASAEVLLWLAGQSYDPGSGARAVLRMVSRLIAAPISNALVDGRLHAGQEVEIGVENGSLKLTGTLQPAARPDRRAG
jgi:ATP-dependent Clp protease ATP-binding subunit ClpC